MITASRRAEKTEQKHISIITIAVIPLKDMVGVSDEGYGWDVRDEL